MGFVGGQFERNIDLGRGESDAALLMTNGKGDFP